jgi:hypothetical protein
MDKQSVLLTALATLSVAGIVVSVTGWVHFGRERKAASARSAGGGDGGD